MVWKERISSPLEAGPSILDAHHLPPHLTPALEYASSRLAKKSLHLTLVVVRRDYQLPSVIPPQGSPGLSTPTTPASPPLSKFSFAAPVTALRQLVRTASRHGPDVARSVDFRSATPSPAAGLESPGLWLRWPLSPATPLSPPPLTPCTPSSVATDYIGPMTPGASGVRFIHAPDLSVRDQRIQRNVMKKTAQKFALGSSLSPALHPSAFGLTTQLITNSLVQNEVLFSSEGLTILSLDSLYRVKSALSSYSKTRSHLRLEDAVDELRRYILANNGAKVTKSDLLRSYDWLSVSSSALLDLDKMYRRAYGGPDGVGAISGISSPSIPALFALEPRVRSDDDDYAFITVTGYEDDFDPSHSPGIGLAATLLDFKKPPSPKGPTLTIQTNFETKPTLRSKWDYDEDDAAIEGRTEKPTGEEDGTGDDEDGDSTARPLETPLPMGFTPWNVSIDNILGASSPNRSSMPRGPMTPNGYDDISPITRGEWGFLLVDDAFQGGRTVPVTTC